MLLLRSRSPPRPIRSLLITSHFQIATRVTKFMIDNFGVSNLFGRHNYEFYARITGRILKVEEDWIFSFRYPPTTLVSSRFSFACAFATMPMIVT